ncbi:hypothetical protein [Clostridium thermobutyricum]|uniref:hypothetical protein n=1 Tax=Clostridium thermobutyricum TaxID=29372 RepID=UPI002943DA1D|nr:hypothetical protein [Clostridium thermobutyricum]
MSNKSLIHDLSIFIIFLVGLTIVITVTTNEFKKETSTLNKQVINLEKQSTIEQENGTSYSVSSKYIIVPQPFFGKNTLKVINSQIVIEKSGILNASTETVNLNNSPGFGVLINLYENLNQVNKEISINNNVSKNTLYNLEEIYNNNINNLGNSLNLKKLFNNLNSLIIDLKNNKTDKINEKVSEMKISLNKFIEYYNSQA